MTALRKESDERVLHDSAIHSLALELKIPHGQVRLVYEDKLEQIRDGARVTDFLAVFVRRSARECLICGGRVKKAKCATRSHCPLQGHGAGDAGAQGGNAEASGSATP